MIKKIENSTSEEDKKMNENALKIGLKAFEGDVKYGEDYKYWRELLGN